MNFRDHPRWSEREPGASELQFALAILLEILDHMATTDEALADLKAAVTAEQAEDAQLLAYLQGIPALISAAVAQALANSSGNADAMAAELEGFATTLKAENASLASGLAGAPVEAAPPPPPPPPPPPVVINTTSLPDAVVGTAYSQALDITGGAPPYAIVVTGLPDGLTADATGLITGTPTTAGASTVGISVADTTSAPAVVSTLTLTVDAASA
jgi:hypothetical protein